MPQPDWLRRTQATNFWISVLTRDIVVSVALVFSFDGYKLSTRTSGSFFADFGCNYTCCLDDVSRLEAGISHQILGLRRTHGHRSELGFGIGDLM